MPAEPKSPGPLRLRLVAYLFPPAGIVRLWRTSQSPGKKILGTVGLLLFCIPHVVLIIYLLLRFVGLQVERRGGYLPVLTWKKTVPNYEVLERSRAQQTNAAPEKFIAANTNSYWDGFRGPHRDGHYAEEPILTNWPAAGLRQLWRQPCGGGYASFAIAAGLAFTIEQRRAQEVVVAYAVETGREVWTHGWPAHFDEAMGGDGPRATPAYSAGRVYALGAQGDLYCFEAQTGQVVWHKNILADGRAAIPTYGIAASPLIVDDKLIVLAGAEQAGPVICYNKQSGEKIWSTLNEPGGYTSPTLINLHGERQVMISLQTNTVGLRLDDGAVRWRFPWRVQLNQLPIAQPVRLGSNSFMLSGGYFTGSTAFEIGLTGDVCLTKELWQSKSLKNKFTSSVFYEGFIYGLDEDILTCLDAATGERKWKDGRYGYGQLILASGHLVILCGNGDLALVKAMPGQHTELARFPAIAGKTWNHPAIGGGRLLVRNGAEMAGFEISVPR